MKESFFTKRANIIAGILGLLVFIGFVLPMVNYHPISYDPVNWTFAEEARITANVGSLFTGVTAWALLIPYIAVLIAVVLSFLSFLTKKLLSIAMVLYLASGLFLIFGNNLFAFSYAFNLRLNYLADLGSSENIYWFLKEALKVIDARAESGVVLSAAIAFVASVFSGATSISKEHISVREITEMGVLLSAAVIFDLLFHFIPNLPMQVGSVSIACLPLMIIALRQGPVKGFVATTLFGLLTCITDGYGIWLFPLDYFVAYSGVAIIGLFKEQIIGWGHEKLTVKAGVLIMVSALLAGHVRLIGSALSSIINYGYTLGPALLCNLYGLVSALICGVLLILMYKPLTKLTNHFDHY